MPSIFKPNDFGVFLGGLVAGTAMWICLYTVSSFLTEEGNKAAQASQAVQVCKGEDDE